ncbi:hypothetical protein JRI60_07220 [Archangium violaceum]|uniref:hypothetical protein n=1 Tax=Archangium violaceum TaxID=83451 RepID=UPI00194EF6A6|nr:hypothetical protein [Archangium violaceum]QRN98813.1 hypothetical protein JRI60_07220 [Archangium violaceum]
MRERLATALLALLLCASPALAQPSAVTAQVPAPVPPPIAPAQQEVVEEDAATEVPEQEEMEPATGEERWGTAHRGYLEVQSQSVNLAEGELRATLANGVLRPARGYVPMEVTLQNPGSTPRVVRIGIESNLTGRSEVAAREVEVGPHQRLVAWVPIPVGVSGGMVRLRSPDATFRPYNFYSVDGEGQSTLVLGSEKSFQSGTSLPRVEKQPKLSVRFVPPEDAPRELASYVGHALVVVAGDVTSVPADAWNALEAYAATGGHLVLVRPPRDVAGRLPLLTSNDSGVQPYGFGVVRLCGKAEECGAGLLSDADAMEAPSQGFVGVVSPVGRAPAWMHGSAMLNNGEQPLLPGVQAPVGRFLILITLFVLAVGPGGLALARRKGPVALLIAVPSVALVTCLAIVAWSVLVEGFSIHAARYSLTWLDREHDRALTVGVGGYYANLEPEGIQIPALGALLGPDLNWDMQVPEADWTNGMVVTGGFLPSRTYREWAEVAAVPSRARLIVRREGEVLRVQNALGAPLVAGYVEIGGREWSLPALADGAEGEATQAPSSTNHSLPELLGFSEPVKNRFARVPWDTLLGPLPEGDFIAKLEGRGMAPSSALEVELHEGLHVVRGRVDGS